MPPLVAVMSTVYRGIKVALGHVEGQRKIQNKPADRIISCRVVLDKKNR